MDSHEIKSFILVIEVLHLKNSWLGLLDGNTEKKLHFDPSSRKAFDFIALSLLLRFLLTLTRN